MRSVPPTTYAELKEWKLVVRLNPETAWSLIQKWLKQYGNPFEELPVPLDDYDLSAERSYYQQALDYVIENRM